MSDFEFVDVSEVHNPFVWAKDNRPRENCSRPVDKVGRTSCNGFKEHPGFHQKPRDHFMQSFRSLLFFVALPSRRQGQGARTDVPELTRARAQAMADPGPRQIPGRQARADPRPEQFSAPGRRGRPPGRNKTTRILPLCAGVFKYLANGYGPGRGCAPPPRRGRGKGGGREEEGGGGHSGHSNAGTLRVWTVAGRPRITGTLKTESESTSE